MGGENRVIEEHVFWFLANHFVKEESYRVFHFSKEQNELWLENPDNKQAPILRLLNCELDWSSWIERDIKLTELNGEKIRKQRYRKKVEIINLYISPYPPVDDYEYRLSQKPSPSNLEVHSFILARSILKEELSKLQTKFNKVINYPSIYQENIDNETIVEMKNDTFQVSAQRVKKEQAIFNYGKPFFTYIFIALQLIVFILLEINGGSTNTTTLIEFGAKFNPLILEGEWWRLIAPIFIHIGFLHIVMNTLGLYYLGTAVEKMYGSARFLWIYLFAGVLGSITSFVFSSNLSAGASGAIYGCFGALLYLGLIYPKLFFRTLGMNVIIILLLNLAISFTIPSVDNAGHLGGLVGGFIATGMVHFPKNKRFFSQLLFILVGLFMFSFLLYYGYHKPVQHQSEAAILQLAQEYIQEKKYEQTYKLLQDYQEHSQKLSEHFYFQLSYVEIQKGMLKEAEDHLTKAVQIEPNFHEAHFNLALILLQQQDIVRAREHVIKASELAPSNKEYQKLLDQINDL